MNKSRCLIRFVAIHSHSARARVFIKLPSQIASPPPILDDPSMTKTRKRSKPSGLVRDWDTMVCRVEINHDLILSLTT
jgi:hypothetical protein